MSTLLDPVPIRRRDHRAPRWPHRSGPAVTPQPVLDVAAAVTRFQRLGATLPGTAVHYAVRANPARALLTALASAGCRFDVAGPAEVVAALEAGAAPSDLMHSGPVGLFADIAFAARLGVRLFAVRSHEDTRKVAAAAPGAAVLCRIAPSEGAGQPGCSPDEAVRVLRAAAVAGLDPAGVSFRLGPQQRDPGAWGPPVARSARVYDALRADGLEPWLLDLGGGFPGPRDDCPPLPSYGAAIETFLRRELGSARPQTLVAPGHAIAAAALSSSRNRA
jgi:ornithine decarboxylase